MNGSGYGGLVLLLLGVACIFVATTSKGKQMIGILFGGGTTAENAAGNEPDMGGGTTPDGHTHSGSGGSFGNESWQVKDNTWTFSS